MNPIPTILILLAVGSLFYVSLPFFTSYSKKKKQILLRNLSRAGAANNLTLCSQEILQNKVMGFDGVHRKIIILEKTENTYYYSIIALDEVHDCQLVTNSGSQKSNNLKKLAGKIPAVTIELQFLFNNKSKPVSIIFSDEFINSKKELVFLKAKAEYWCTMFSKLLSRHVEVAA